MALELDRGVARDPPAPGLFRQESDRVEMTATDIAAAPIDSMTIARSHHRRLAKLISRDGIIGGYDFSRRATSPKRSGPHSEPSALLRRRI
jgi:hypothetical protein